MSTVQIQNDQFYQAVTYVFKSWTALKLAVEMQWGGVDSEDKRDWLVDVVVEKYENEIIDAMDISEDVSSNNQNKMYSSKKEPIIDDEGFQLVTKRRK
ncbi:31217_t:CDS:2 [Gigaspora margarita]|uniref:31217_t:CDS:1 n=1 Tax=Gigaspora margarita TaxID=4874 RepID=A0ABN7V371_GIGMA|nr:31217_t:CDS:2 [Gigaspora margarita]